MSPKEVLDSAVHQSPGLGIATVYRTLKSGVDSGWLTQVELPGEPPGAIKSARGSLGLTDRLRCAAAVWSS